MPNETLYEQAKERIFNASRKSLKEAIQALETEMSEKVQAVYRLRVPAYLAITTENSADFRTEVKQTLLDKLGIPAESWELNLVRCNDDVYRGELVISFT